MPAVKPPEWDAMSAKEQLLWYLERLCAQADEMSSVLGIASAGAPPVVTLLDPAASTTTHASLAPVPDVSGSTTKAQEVLEVSHDAPPTCIAMAHITCSTDGSNQVVAINSVNKVTTVCPDLAIDLNTTTAVFPELAVIRNDKEVEQLPSHAVIEEDTAPGVDTTDVFTQRVSPVTTVVYDNANKIAAPAATVLLTVECSRSCLADTPKLLMVAMAFPQVWQKWMLIRPTPWPSFAFSHEGKILEHDRLLPQVTYEEWMMSVSDELQGYDLPGASREPQPKPQPLFEFNQETIQLKPPWPSVSCYCQPLQVLSMSVHWILLLRPPAGERTSEVCCFSVAGNFGSFGPSL